MQDEVDMIVVEKREVLCRLLRRGEHLRAQYLEALRLRRQGAQEGRNAFFGILLLEAPKLGRGPRFVGWVFGTCCRGGGGRET